MSRTVIGGQLAHVSATSTNEHMRCKRRFYLHKVKGVPQPSTKSKDRGESVHRELQRYKEEGTPPGDKSLQQLFIDYPERAVRDPAILIEHPRDYNLDMTAAEVPVRGRIDELDLRDPKHPHVIDLKTRSKFQYCSTQEELARDTQLIIYAEHVFQHYPEAESATLTHAYTRTTGGPAAKVVSSEPLSREHVAECYGHVEDEVRAMKQTILAPDYLDVEPNWEACEDFGGCPYQNLCDMSVSQRLSMMFKKDSSSSTSPPTPGAETVSLVDRLAALRTAQINPPDAAKPAAPPPAVVDTPPVTLPETTAATPEPASESVPESTPAPVPPPPAPPEAPQPAPALTLLVDCVALRSPFQNVIQLEDEIARRSAIIIANAVKVGATTPDTKDVREMKYGEGTASLVASFRLEPLHGVVQASSNGLGAQVVEALIPQAAVVIRGLR